MGLEWSTEQGISSHKRNQQIEMMLANGRYTPAAEHVYALLTCNETVSYCDDITDYLFKYHLSQTTLHYNIMSQLRQLIQFTRELHRHSIFNNIQSTSILTSSLFEIQNSKHSCQVILNQLTEDSPITPEIGKAIAIIFQDAAIQHCITIIKMVQTQLQLEDEQKNDTCTNNSNNYNNINNIDNNRTYDQELIKFVVLKLSQSEYWFDISFCEYFFENMLQYTARICDDNDNYSPLIFDDKTLIDYELKLCHCDYNCNNTRIHISKGQEQGEQLQRNIRFILEDEIQIVIFNVDDNHTSNILSLGSYKKILTSFSSIIFCLPLSWFDKMEKECIYASHDHQRLSFDKMKTFYQNIVNCDNERYEYWDKNECEKVKAKNEYISKHGWRDIPSHLHSYSFIKGPCKSIWIIPDLENIKMSTKNGNNNINYNRFNNSLQESKLIESLLHWKTIFPKYLKSIVESVQSASIDNNNNNNNQVNGSDNPFANEVRQSNVYFQFLINYTSISADMWSKLRQQCFNGGYGMMRFRQRYRDIYRRNIDRGTGLGLDNDIHTNMIMTDEEKLQAAEKRYLDESNMKHDLNSIYRQRNQCHFHWSYNNAGNRIIHDPRLEYFRIYLNYPTLYKPNASVYRHYREYGHDLRAARRLLGFRHRYGETVTDRDLMSHLCLMEQLCRLVSKKWSNSRDIDYYFHVMGSSIATDPDNRRLNDMFNFVYCDKIEKLFEYAEKMIDNQFNVIDNSHGDIGITIERAICFGFKDRLNTILKNKSLFVDRDLDEKKKKAKSRLGHMVVGNASGDEFDFENYIRLALNDWNFSLLSLLKKSSQTSRAPFRTTVQRLRMCKANLNTR